LVHCKAGGSNFEYSGVHVWVKEKRETEKGKRKKRKTNLSKKKGNEKGNLELIKNKLMNSAV